MLNSVEDPSQFLTQFPQPILALHVKRMGRKASAQDGRDAGSRRPTAQLSRYLPPRSSETFPTAA